MRRVLPHSVRRTKGTHALLTHTPGAYRATGRHAKVARHMRGESAYGRDKQRTELYPAALFCLDLLGFLVPGEKSRLFSQIGRK